jgi:iron complex outermembrane receptor protein
MDLRRRVTPAVDEWEHILDVDAQYRLRAGRHDLVVGGGGRDADIGTKGSLTYSVVPSTSEAEILNVFAQDEISLGERLQVTVGSKFASDSATGWGVQPTARVMWQIAPERQRAWIAYSRALRTPSAHDLGMRVNFAAVNGPAGIPIVFGLVGNPQYHAEEFTDVEAGYRLSVRDKASFDVTAFRGEYDHLQTLEPMAPVFEAAPGIPHIFMARRPDNLLEADTHGMEIAARWDPVSWWRLDGSYAFLNIRPRLSPASQDPDAATFDGNAPRHQSRLHSLFSLGDSTELDVSVSHVGELRTIGVPGYVRTDLRLQTTLTAKLSLVITGQNLLDATHAEFGGSTLTLTPTLMRRNGSLRLVWAY